MFLLNPWYADYPWEYKPQRVQLPHSAWVEYLWVILDRFSQSTGSIGESSKTVLQT